MEFCENFTYEDNFNNTFFDKILPHTTAVVTEFRAKVRQFPETTNINMKICPQRTQIAAIGTDN